MTGADHYRDAERAFENAKASVPGGKQEHFQLAAATYHSTMALTAATALQAVLPLIGDDQQVTDWCKAIGIEYSTPELVRIDDALALIDQMEQDGQIVDGAERLRQVLRRTNEGK